MTITIRPDGPYSLAASQRFLHGFTPASGGSAAPDETSLALAFCLDGTWQPVGALLRQRERDGPVDVDVVAPAGVDAGAVVAQAKRTLGLDVDARAWGDIGKRDPVLGALLATEPGWRAVAFPSPWEAAVWGLLAHRISMKQAAGIKRKTAEAHGDVVVVAGQSIPLFPSPQQVLALPHAPPSIPHEKWTRIAGVARAALDGKLDPAKLRALSPQQAHEELQQLRGVGAWTAGHIHIRGAATVDVVALEEPRVRRAVQVAYKLKSEPDDDEMLTISERWKPYRTWAMVLLAVHLNRGGGWNSAKGKRGARPRVKQAAKAKAKAAPPTKGAVR